MHGGFNARPLGTLLLIEAALALDVSLKDSTAFKLSDYVDGISLKKENAYGSNESLVSATRF